MATDNFTARGGSEPEFNVYKALLSTGRREPADFVFRPLVDRSISFIVNSPRVGIRVGTATDGIDLLRTQQFTTVGRVETISDSVALADAPAALSRVLGG